jgi:DNA phosphorothioation-dependent restriction protein DptG
MYSLIETARFEREFKRLPEEIQRRFNKQFKKIRDDPFSIGKPLGSKWLRELKNEGCRAYYLIYEQEIIVLLVDVSTKKKQKMTIEGIKNNVDQFKIAVGNKAYKDL